MKTQEITRFARLLLGTQYVHSWKLVRTLGIVGGDRAGAHLTAFKDSLKRDIRACAQSQALLGQHEQV